MKLPWDKEYLKISFHVIFTLLIVCIIGIVFFNIVPIFKTIINTLYKAFSIFSPLWIGIVIAYLLDPLADYFQKKYSSFLNNNYNRLEALKKKLKLKINPNKKTKNRLAGAILTYIAILLAIIVIGLFVSSSIGNSSSIENMVNKVMQSLNSFSNLLDNMQNKVMQFGVAEQIEQVIDMAIGQITSFIAGISNQIVVSVSKTGGIIVDLFIAIVIGFYFLKDKKIILNKVNEFANILIPKKINAIVKTIIENIDAVFSGYIRGQLTDAMIMAVLISISLSIIKIDFSILIGIISGFSNVIPYIGAFVGLALAVMVGLLNGNIVKALTALIVMLVLQQIDSIFISPRVLGTQVDLHPVLVILALSVGGSMFGLWGMILAVPVTAILKIFLYRYIERKKQKA